MRILVVTSKGADRASAETTLKGQDIVIASSFREAIEILAVVPPEKTVRNYLNSAGFKSVPHGADPVVMSTYRRALRQAEEMSAPPLGFDAVLTDADLPMCPEMLLPRYYQPEELVPYGYIVALKAAQRGAKFVAVVNDTPDTDGAMSAALAYVAGGRHFEDGAAPVFSINNAKCVFTHAPLTDGGAKDWGRVLTDLTVHSGCVPYMVERRKTHTDLTVPPVPAVQPA